MRIAIGLKIFEKPPFFAYSVFFTNILQTVESGSKEPGYNLGSAVPWVDKS